MIVDSQLRSVRETRGLSREALASRAGVSVSSIVRIESGDYHPNLTTLRKIAEALEVPIGRIFDLEAAS